MKTSAIRHLLLSLVAIVALSVAQTGLAQHALYPSHFDLHEVVLLDSPFKKAQERNYQTLLEYDVDRLLTPFVRQSGLSQTHDEHNKYYNWEVEHPNFESWAWNPIMAMDGHLGGHYLSALSISYASCQDEAVRAKLKQRIDYMVLVLCDCQAAYDNDHSGLKGFIGGIPDNEVWKTLYAGDYRVYNQRGNWVPLYCEHKIMAGLRDAYVYAGSERAKEAFRKLCDWMIDEVHLFKEDVMEMQILQWEPGGVNEVLADAYYIFDESKYIKAAQKFSHQIVIENMMRDDRHDFLDQKNANENAAKFVGYARINELRREERYKRAIDAFWADVTETRSTAIGAAGVNSFFQPVNKSSRYISEGDGPDACSSYNMLKLAERLFDDFRSASYADYYERVLVNHILANQDNRTGGYVYFTSLRPESYRIYSQPDQAMWCCVGSGMESQSKYGDFIYTLDDDTLFVNLFIPSELRNERYALRQESSFPYGTKSVIRILKPGRYALAVRRPDWASPAFDIKVNGKTPKGFKAEREDMHSYYVTCGKSWKEGDVIEISYPMSLSFVECPKVPTYIALRYGPTVLAGVTSTSTPEKPFRGEYAGSGRRDYSNAVVQKFPSLALAPMLITDRSMVPLRIQLQDPSTLTFDVDATAKGSPWKHLTMKPFFDTQHGKYTVYWNQQTESAWLRNPMYLREVRNLEIDEVTFDRVDVGDDASEKAHQLKTSETASYGTLNDHSFRDCQSGQWFEYSLDVTKLAEQCTVKDSVALLLRVSLLDRGRGGFVIVDGTRVGQLVIPASVKNATKDRFFEVAIVFSSSMVKGKKSIRVRLQGPDNAIFPRLYNLRMVKYDPKLLQGLMR